MDKTVDVARVSDKPLIKGFVVARLFGPDGKLKMKQQGENLITEVGDQYYAERANAIGTLGVLTGMKLGEGTTAPSKTGLGAALAVYIGASQRPFDAAPTSQLSGAARRITFQSTWAAGVATSAGITEVILTNESPLGDTPLDGAAGAAANTIARLLFTAAFAKGAGDSLVVTWTQDFQGA